ncbi:hypothetical protein DFH09DRAFT_1362543 [Mycena vulgaris]|nr:hypothetical protein DFH09DRAFT_1362543 [Mycena vulgaris]
MPTTRSAESSPASPTSSQCRPRCLPQRSALSPIPLAYAATINSVGFDPATSVTSALCTEFHGT